MIIFGFGVAIALAAAARSTWSPCGLSMLSQITPLAEAGRGQKFARTAAWFILGATVGGLTLGIAMGGVAIAFASAGVGHAAAISLIVVAALAGAAIDAGVLGFGPPYLCRQVNDAWLAKYRPWVYGSGFGWQIGVGVTTYVMTAAVPLMIVVGALSGSFSTALTVGVSFGLARGLAVLMGARLRTQAALFAFHRRFDAWTEPVRRIVVGVQLVVAIVAAWIVAPTFVAIGVSVAASALVAKVPSSRGDRRAPQSRRTLRHARRSRMAPRSS